MANGLRRSNRVVGRSRRKTGWEEGPGTNNVVAVSASQSSILGLGQQFVQDGLTIVRIRGTLEVTMSTAASAGDGFVGAFGIGIVTAPAFGVGIGSMPTPIDEIEWNGWIWHQLFQYTSSIAGGFGTTPKDSLHIEIDTKAMRKTSLEQVLFLAGQFVEVGSSAIRVTGATRMLLKLP